AVAEFELSPPSSPAAIPPALDPGERVLWAEFCARRAEIVPGADPAISEKWLLQAIASVDAVLSEIPDGHADLPVSALLNPRGKSAFDAEPGRFRRDRLKAYREALASQLQQPNASPESGGGSPTPDLEREACAREAALASISIVRAQVQPILNGI